MEVFDYVHNAYNDVIVNVKENKDSYYNLGYNYWMSGKVKRELLDVWKKRFSGDLFPFELDLCKKYSKIPQQVLWGMMDFNYFWYHVK